jgi:hypothetical protein
MRHAVFHTPAEPAVAFPSSSHLHCALGLAAYLLMVGCDEPSRPPESTGQEIAAAVQSTGGAPPSHVNINGPYADLYETYFNGSIYRQIQVSIWSTPTRGQAFLSYVIGECDPVTFDCQSVEEGTGPIPGDDLIARPGRLELSTNTAVSANPEFALYTGSGGPIHITWTELSGWSSSSNFHLRYRTDNVLVQSHGTQTFSGALADGSLLGIELEPSAGYATMGTIRNGEITILREP